MSPVRLGPVMKEIMLGCQFAQCRCFTNANRRRQVGHHLFGARSPHYDAAAGTTTPARPPS